LPTVDSYGNVWAIGYGLCKGGPNPSLLKINIASGKIIQNINIGSLPNSGKSSYTYMSDLNADKNGNLYALGTYQNGNFTQTDLIRLNADDASLLENYDSLLPQANKKSAPFYGYQMDSKGHLWVYSEFWYSDGTSNTVTTLIDPLSSSSSSSQVGSVLKTYNNLSSYGLIDLAHNKSYVNSFDYSVGPPSEDQGIYDLSSDNGINGKLKNVGYQGLVDSNNNLWFLNAGTNLMKGGGQDPMQNTYVPSSISFVNGSNGATKVFKDSSFGIFAPLSAVQDGNNIWVINMGPYDSANQVFLPTITIMNVNTQSLVKVLYNHQ
jgi:hypothetical protein